MTENKTFYGLTEEESNMLRSLQNKKKRAKNAIPKLKELMQLYPEQAKEAAKEILKMTDKKVSTKNEPTEEEKKRMVENEEMRQDFEEVAKKYGTTIQGLFDHINSDRQIEFFRKYKSPQLDGAEKREVQKP